MLIDLRSLLKNEVNEVPFSYLYNVNVSAEFAENGVTAISPVEITGNVKRVFEDLVLNVDFKSTVTMQCSRCLDETEYNLIETVARFISDQPTEDINAIELNGQKSLDLNVIMDEELLISLPHQLLCNDDCLGLCHTCGINLNHKTCDCNNETFNHKFDALKNLFND